MPEGGERHAHAAAPRLRASARLRAEGHGRDAGRQGRPPAGERLPGRRHLAGGHREVGEAQPRPRDPGLGLQGLHPVQPVRARLPARRDPRQGLRRRRRSPAPPATFKSTAYRGTEYKGKLFTIQVAPEDCTGCNLCVNVCPAKDRTNPKHKAINMAAPGAAARGRARQLRLLPRPARDRRATEVARLDHKGSQFLEPLFEYSGACAGCGETPYLKLLTQLFGDRLLIANATGCSSIYGGNLPTTPYTTNRDGRGPAWSNSLFEDNAEFGFGFRLALDAHVAAARVLVERLAPEHRRRPRQRSCSAPTRPARRGIAAQRERVAALQSEARRRSTLAEARRLETLADYLVKKSVWLVGGDGWAYDIGYGGLDHVLAEPARRQRARPRHRGLLQHRRPGVEGDAARGRGQVRRRGKAGRQEGPGPAGQHVRPRLRRARRLRRQDGPDRAGLPRGRGLPRAIAHHRLQPLHRPRLRHGPGRGAAEAGRGLGRLAALPLRSAPPGRRASRRFTSTTARPRPRSPTTCATSRASA